MPGQPVLDDTSSAKDTDTTTINLVTHTPASGGDVIAFITVSVYRSSGSVPEVDRINYGINPILSWESPHTFILQKPDEIFLINHITYDSGTRRVAMFWCTIPPGGIGSPVLTITMATQVDVMMIGCTTYTNSDPNSPLYSSIISTGTGLTASLSLSTIDNTSQKVIGILGTTGLTVTEAADQTGLYTEINGFTTTSSDENPDGTSTTHSYDLGGTRMWGMLVVAFTHPSSFDVSVNGVASVTAKATVTHHGVTSLVGVANFEGTPTDPGGRVNLIGVASITPSASVNVDGVVIQPTGAFALDTHISAKSAQGSVPDQKNFKYGLKDRMRIGDAGNHRIIIEFPLYALRGGIINSASLTFHTLTSPSSEKTVTISRLNRADWDPSTCSYNEFQEGAPWAAIGGDLATSVPSSFTSIPPTSGDWVINESGLTTMVQDAIDNRGGKLILHMRMGNHPGVFGDYASGTYIDKTKAPKLLIKESATDFGYTYRGFKRQLGNWVAGRPVEIGYMAFGIGGSEGSPQDTGTDLLEGWRERRRLMNEVIRVPLSALTLDVDVPCAHAWGFLDVNSIEATSEVSGDFRITEVALFSQDTTTTIDKCNSTTNWAGTGWVISAPASRVEGTGAIKAVAASQPTDPVIRSNLSIDLTSYSLDDYIQYWMYFAVGAPVANIDTFTFQLEDTDAVGVARYWTWKDIHDEMPVQTGKWAHIQLRFSDAVVTPVTAGQTLQTSSGPGTVTKMLFDLRTTTGGFDHYFIDHIRMIKHDEDILAWMPPPGGTLSRVIGDRTKFRMNITLKKSSN